MAASFLQAAITPVTGSGTTITVNFATCTPGSLLAVQFYSGAADADQVTASDSANGAWTAGVSVPSGSGGVLGGLYFKNNASSGTPTLTLATNAGSANWAVKAYEIGGLAGGGDLDKTAQTAATTSTNPNAGSSGTLAQASEAAIALCTTSGSGTTATAGSGWTIDAVEPVVYGQDHHFERRITSATTAITGDFVAVSTTWQAILMTFKDGAGGGGSNTTITPSQGGLVLTGKTVAVTVSASGTAQPSTGAITLSGKTPTVTRSAAGVAQPTAGALVLSGNAPTVARTVMLVTPVIKNNTGTVLASETGATVNIYDTSTGALVLQKTGQTTSGSGIMTVTDATGALVLGTTYAYEVKLASAGRRLPTATAA